MYVQAKFLRVRFVRLIYRPNPGRDSFSSAHRKNSIPRLFVLFFILLSGFRTAELYSLLRGFSGRKICAGLLMRKLPSREMGAKLQEGKIIRQKYQYYYGCIYLYTYKYCNIRNWLVFFWKIKRRVLFFLITSLKSQDLRKGFCERIYLF